MFSALVRVVSASIHNTTTAYDPVSVENLSTTMTVGLSGQSEEVWHSEPSTSVSISLKDIPNIPSSEKSAPLLVRLTDPSIEDEKFLQRTVHLRTGVPTVEKGYAIDRLAQEAEWNKRDIKRDNLQRTFTALAERLGFKLPQTSKMEREASDPLWFGLARTTPAPEKIFQEKRLEASEQQDWLIQQVLINAFSQLTQQQPLSDYLPQSKVKILVMLEGVPNNVVVHPAPQHPIHTKGYFNAHPEMTKLLRDGTLKEVVSPGSLGFLLDTQIGILGAETLKTRKDINNVFLINDFQRKSEKSAPKGTSVTTECDRPARKRFDGDLLNEARIRVHQLYDKRDIASGAVIPVVLFPRTKASFLAEPNSDTSEVGCILGQQMDIVAVSPHVENNAPGRSIPTQKQTQKKHTDTSR